MTVELEAATGGKRSLQRIEVNGRQLLVVELDGHSYRLCEHPFWDGFVAGWERNTYRAFRRFLKPGGLHVDIGAWIGPTVLYAASLGAGRIVAVEANPETYAMLNENCRLNPELAARATVCNVCITDRPGPVTFGLPEGTDDTSRASLRGRGAEVQGISLLTFLQQQNALAAELIKIDIEGAETLIGPDLEALAAAAPQARIYLSLHPPFWDSYAAGQRLLQALGHYRLWRPKHMRRLPLALCRLQCRVSRHRPYLCRWPVAKKLFHKFFEIVLEPKPHS